MEKKLGTETEASGAEADCSVRLKAQEEKEPILCPKRRFSLFPLEFPEVFALGKLAVSSFWTTEEVDLAEDQKTFRNLEADERRMLLRVLAFFASADGLVVDNLQINVIGAVTLPEAQYFYCFQAASEAVHNEMYSLIIEAYAENETEKGALFGALESVPSIKSKAAWCSTWMMKDTAFALRLFAFGLVEAVFFSSSFAVIFWFRSRNLLPGLSAANDLISRDEGLHVRFAALLFSKLLWKPGEDVIHRMTADAVSTELAFIADTVPAGLAGITPDGMSTHVKSVADYVLESFGYGRLFFEETPYAFMKLQALEGKSNFFERRETSYRRFENPHFNIRDEF